MANLHCECSSQYAFLRTSLFGSTTSIITFAKYLYPPITHHLHSSSRFIASHKPDLRALQFVDSRAKASCIASNPHTPLRLISRLADCRLLWRLKYTFQVDNAARHKTFSHHPPATIELLTFMILGTIDCEAAGAVLGMNLTDSQQSLLRHPGSKDTTTRIPCCYDLVHSVPL